MMGACVGSVGIHDPKNVDHSIPSPRDRVGSSRRPRWGPARRISPRFVAAFRVRQVLGHLGLQSGAGRLPMNLSQTNSRALAGSWSR
jgi:hypothetical protein